MKYKGMVKVYGLVYGMLVKPYIKDKSVRKEINLEYKKIMERSKDIGTNNMLLSSYTLCAYFIAMNRCNKVSANDNYLILDKSLRNSSLIRLALGNSKSYFSKKRMDARYRWSELTKQKKYENDWVVDVIPKSDKYEFGFNYTECGVCKMCRDEGCFHLAKYLCKLDFMLVSVIGIELDRNHTLANGDSLCDFRFKKGK